MPGFAVVDVETTGLFPRAHDRIVEIGIVQVSAIGEIEQVWSTLLNPERDLGPQHIHGIKARDAHGAPKFAEVAGHIAELLQGRVFTAHNASFDLKFIQSEFAAAGHQIPLNDRTSMCTMHLASAFFPDAPRALAGCCQYFGIPLARAHAAESDALAAAAILRRVIEWEASSHLWDDTLTLADMTPWPAIPVHTTTAVHRDEETAEGPSFLSTLTRSLPSRPDPAGHQAYLALLDRALLDRYLSAREQDGLARTATDLGIGREQALSLHRTYLTDLAIAALDDDVLTEAERTDLDQVARLLGLGPSDVEAALMAAAWAAPRPVGVQR